MIKIKNLTKVYKKVRAVDGVSLEIEDNQTFALLGLNGAGKTTLINMLSTQISPTSGGAEINGLTLGKDNIQIRKIINVCPQETAVAKRLTVRENLQLIATLYGVESPNIKAQELIEKFSLEEKADSKVKTLSGGQAKRLSLALALVNQPKILFLDEPTLGLDVKARKILWDIILELNKSMTIILTTHYLEEVENLASSVAIISCGKIKANGSVEEIVKQANAKNLEDAFLKLTEEE